MAQQGNTDMHIDRRGFLSLTAAAGAGLACGARLCAAEFKTTIKKARQALPKDADGWKKIKDQGFDGVEGRGRDVEVAARAREAAEKAGLRIHSVLGGWNHLTSRDPEKVQGSIDGLAKTLKAAHAFGADAMLLVPGKIGGMPMPEAWDFKLSFDHENGHLTRVIEGENAPYKTYIEEHNSATDAARESIKRLIPVAEETKVVIAVENVWNNLWVKPDFFKWFVDSFKSPWVKAYFDIGNHVKYAPPEEWIATLGTSIAKLHAKDFALNPDGHGGKFTPLRQGSVNWPSVRRALDKIGYNGWITIEGRGTAQDLELIVKGE